MKPQRQTPSNCKAFGWKPPSFKEPPRLPRRMGQRLWKAFQLLSRLRQDLDGQRSVPNLAYMILYVETSKTSRSMLKLGGDGWI